MEIDVITAGLRALSARLGAAATTRDVWCQVVRDWTDKEVQRSYTVTYVWMTNQLGHFTLGFLLTFVIVWAIQIIHSWYACPEVSVFATEACRLERSQFVSGWLLLVPILQVAGWAAKEYRDYAVTMREAKAAGGSFPFNGWDVALDAATAVWFITIGIVVAYLSFVSWATAVVAFGVGLVLALIPARYWLIRKLCFQQAALPFLHRLADFVGTFKPSNQDGVQAVTDFLIDEGKIRHLFVFGAMGSGRTSLAVAIATERTFAVRSARYLPWAKFVEAAQDDSDVEDGRHVWRWRQSDFVVLDDVDKVVGGRSNTLPAEIVADLAALPPGVVPDLAARKTIWVLGPNQDGWVTNLSQALGVAHDTCGIVEIEPPTPALAAAKPRLPFGRFSGR